MSEYARFAKELGRRIREIRKKRHLTQEDMQSHKFATRHWQQIEAGRPITVETLWRISKALKTPLVDLFRGLDKHK